MIFLELHNRGVQELLISRFENARQGFKFEKFETTTADFDGVIYRMRSAPNDRSKVIVSIVLSCFPELQAFGAIESLRREYEEHLCNQPENGFDVSLVYDMSQLSDDYNRLAYHASLLKRNCFAGLYEYFFALQAHLEETASTECDSTVIHYRPDETLYIRAQADRVTVIFSTIFHELDDIIIGKVFLQEFTEVRRRYDRAPQVLYSQGSPPSELLGTSAAVGDNVAYITFVLFPRHLTPEAAPRSINLLHNLRNYLHYHIKCSKGYVHRRIGAKTVEFIKILNRARPHSTSTIAAGGASGADRAAPVIQLPMYPGAVVPSHRLLGSGNNYPSITSFNSSCGLSTENGVVPSFPAVVEQDRTLKTLLATSQSMENGCCHDKYTRFVS